MGCLANILWLIFGGLEAWFAWTIYGILWSITIVGIPLGRQCFKFARLSLAPFGKDVSVEGGPVSLLANIVWCLFTGVEMALAHVTVGIGLCLTIIGIPFGIQHFKLAVLSLFPFGSRVI